MKKLYIDTDVCHGYAQQIAQARALYEAVMNWTMTESVKCSKVVSENSYIDMNDPAAAEKVMKAHAASSRQMGLMTVNGLMGARCLARLENHFLETVSRINAAEQAICSRGEKLFDL